MVPSEKTNENVIRYAPSVIIGKGTPCAPPQLGAHPYTIIQVAQFLGFTKKEGKDPQVKVVAAMRYLELTETLLLASVLPFAAIGRR
jgi:hypothetical protein